MKTLIDNRKANFNFEILDKYEAGLLLQGWEVKSLKSGRGSVNGSYIKLKDNEAFLVGATIVSWNSGFEKNLEQEKRDRKLLLQKNQIKKILTQLKQSGITSVPLEIYVNDKNLIKILIGIVKGKKKFDKRQKLKNQDLKRRIEEERKKYNF